ncbi:MAG: uncharacterized protein QOF02_241 [Blastocatellia bacterium]|jgi:phage baseplate assembly protein W|nr:uncharacterized protein [Blastocatellia bacterium]
MSIQGSWLAHPFRPDQRGTLVTVSDRVAMVKQSLEAIIETRQGERVMAPEYGLPDFVFGVIGIGFAATVAYHVTRQAKRFEPLLDQIRARVGEMRGSKFAPGVAEDQQRAVIYFEFTVHGSNTPFNMTFPVWEFRNGTK